MGDVLIGGQSKVSSTNGTHNALLHQQHRFSVVTFISFIMVLFFPGFCEGGCAVIVENEWFAPADYSINVATANATKVCQNEMLLIGQQLYTAVTR